MADTECCPESPVTVKTEALLVKVPCFVSSLRAAAKVALADALAVPAARLVVAVAALKVRRFAHRAATRVDVVHGHLDHVGATERQVASAAQERIAANALATVSPLPPAVVAGVDVVVTVPREVATVGLTNLV